MLIITFLNQIYFYFFWEIEFFKRNQEFVKMLRLGTIRNFIISFIIYTREKKVRLLTNILGYF